MKIQCISDLHLEFQTGMQIATTLDSIISNKNDADVLVLAGDAIKLIDIDNYKAFFNVLNNNYKKVFYITGNHEHYDSKFADVDRLKEFLDDYSNIVNLHNEKYVYNDVTFYGSPLWTDFKNGDQIVMLKSRIMLSDFSKIIGSDFYSVSPDKILEFHEKCVEFLNTAKEDHGKKIVISHHAPSFKSISEKYKGQDINYCFASELEDLIQDISPQYWIHGHVHDSFNYFIENTNVICNPHGYVNRKFEKENSDFKFDFLIDI